MRILHTSIPVRDPQRVAQALAELVEGATFDFLHPGCYFVTFGEPGTLIELYRKEIELRPGEPGKPCMLSDSESPARCTGSHTAIRVSADADRVLEIAGARPRLVPAQYSAQYSERPPRTDCLIGEKLWQQRFEYWE